MTYHLSLAEAAEQRQKTAIHEAGHAVVLFAFQVPAFYGIELSTIDALRSDEDGYSGMVRMAEWYAFINAHSHQLSSNQRQALHQFEMMNSMGGPLAEVMFSDQSLLDYYPEHWLDEVLNGFDNGFDKDRYMIERAASSLVGEQNRQQERLIIKVANWVEELFRNPAVEASVKQLAKTLYRKLSHEPWGTFYYRPARLLPLLWAL